MTPRVLQKVVWAGANSGSYAQAEAALLELADVRLSVKQIRRAVQEIGNARLAERDAAVEQLQTMPLPQRRQGNRASEPPELGVISMDGGRYQRRDHFRPRRTTDESANSHWRETKVGCLLSMRSDVHSQDPTPEFPAWLASSAAVAELAKVPENALVSPSSPAEEAVPLGPDELGYEPPELVSREVLASSHDAERFGWDLESRAWQLGFPAAERQAFVADGLAVNWTIAERHFPRATPILDLMHALAYAWSAAVAAGQGDSYPRWAEQIWQGQVTQVIAALAELRERWGPPSDQQDSSDPRHRIDRAWTYYTNNQSRMNYPEYRRRGLPLTSSHIESTVKLVNQRIKGTEKFWRRDSGDAVLQLRSDTLSDSQPLRPFWKRWQAQQTGSNCYQTAT